VGDSSRTIKHVIGAYSRQIAREHHRYRSWEDCYGYFRRARPAGLSKVRDDAALHLAFYLASWGMYRGSAFLLQYSHTVHRNAIDVLGEERFDALWKADFGANGSHQKLVPKLFELTDAITDAYQPFAEAESSSAPTDTLVTKVVLGTFGCIPACDRLFKNGFKSRGFPYSRLNGEFVERVLAFCQEHLSELLREQTRIEQARGMRYPLMKLVDMDFWQIGMENQSGRPS
jgi:hypothetical protein